MPTEPSHAITRGQLTRDVLLKLLESGKRPASMQREDIDRWAGGLAELAVTLADATFNFLDAPRSLTPADIDKTVREVEAQYREDISAWKRRAETAEEELYLLKRDEAA